MRKIEITEATYKRLQLHAKPFEDNEDKIINVALDSIESNLKSIKSDVSSIDSDITLIDPNNLPDLTHTKIIVAKINQIEVRRKNWRNILEAVLEPIIKEGETVDNINIFGQLTAVGGNFEKNGYKFISSLNISIPTQDSAHVCKSIVSLAKKYQVKIEIKFRWRSEKASAFPDKVAILRVN